jgi:hypothetical protein
MSLPSSYRSRRGHIHLLQVLPLVGAGLKHRQKDLPPRKRVVHNQTLCHHSEESLLRQIVAEGQRCKHGGSGPAMPPTKLCGAQPNLCGALRTIAPTTTKHDYNWRVHCEKYAKRRSHPIQRGLTWWRQCKYCLWAWASSPSTAGSIRWRGCLNLLWARVQLPRLPIPTTGGRLRRRRSFSFLFFFIFSVIFSLCLRSVFSFYLKFSKCVSLFSACNSTSFHH